MKNTILYLIHEYPDLVYPLLAGLVWPLLSAGANAAQGLFAHRFPRLSAALRASGLDLGGVARAVALRRAPKELRDALEATGAPTPRTARPEP